MRIGWAGERIPESVDKVLGWESVGPNQMRKLCWENAVRFFGEP